MVARDWVYSLEDPGPTPLHLTSYTLNLKNPLDNLRPHALNYCSCSRILKQEPSTPSSPGTPPTSYRKPSAVSSASSTTSSISPGATTPQPTATTCSGPHASSTTEDSAKSPGTGRRCRPRNQRNPIITRITVQTVPKAPTRTVGSLQPARRQARAEARRHSRPSTGPGRSGGSGSLS